MEGEAAIADRTPRGDIAARGRCAASSDATDHREAERHATERHATEREAATQAASGREEAEQGAPMPDPGPPSAPQRPLADLEAALAALGATPPTRSEPPGRPLVPGVSLQHRGDAGVDAEIRGLGEGFRLALRDRGASPWFSLELQIPPQALARARFFGLRVRGASEAGALSLRPVLRLNGQEGWRDLEFGRELVFTPEPAENLVCLALDPAESAEAVSAVLILFLRQRAGALRIAALDPFVAA